LIKYSEIMVEAKASWKFDGRQSVRIASNLEWERRVSIAITVAAT